MKLGQECEVHAERLVGHVTAARDFLRQLLALSPVSPVMMPSPPAFDIRGGKLGKADKVHAAWDVDANSSAIAVFTNTSYVSDQWTI